jgi:hypothetical protein
VVESESEDVQSVDEKDEDKDEDKDKDKAEKEDKNNEMKEDDKRRGLQSVVSPPLVRRKKIRGRN